VINLDWMPTLTFEETVEMTASWYRNWNDKSIAVKDFSASQIKHFEEHAKQRGMIWTRP
jgi:dTDP-D-glucose 4,6-dehydratase